MERRTMMTGLGLLALAACGRAPRPRLGPDGLPLPTIYRIGPENEAEVGYRLLDGVNSLRAAAGAGLRGVAFEAGGTLLTDGAACITEADAAGLFLLGIDATSATPEVSNQGSSP